jgi:hypothetical protein
MRVKHSGGSIDKFKLGSDTSLGATPEGVVAWSCFKKGTSDNNVAADCGFRTSDGASAVVTAKSSFTVMGWIHKRGSIPGHQWWHVFTDGHSGDLLTVRGRHGGNFEATMNSGGWGGSFEAGGFNGHKWSGPSSKHNFNALSDNAWHSLAVRYEKDKRTLTLFVDGEKGQVRRNVKINPAFKLRNFFGWGSRNSNYKYEGWFGSVLVHRTALDDGQITHNHYATAPAHMAGAKAPIRMRVFADSTTKARSGLSLGPAWLSSTSIKFVTTKLDRKPSWRMGGGGFDQHGMPDSWQVLGPFSNGASCTLDGGLGKTSEKIPDGSKIGAAAPAPGEDDTTSGKKWDLYKFNFAARMQSFCDTCNDHRGVDLDCHWGGASKGDRMGFAVTYVFSDSDRTSHVRVGGNSYKLWINGDLVVDRGSVCAAEGSCYNAAGTTLSNVQFKKGRNTIVIQLGQAVVKKPGLSFVLTMDQFSGFRASAHPGFDRDVPHVAITQFAIASTTTWQQAQDKCDAEGMQLCSREMICPDGKLKTPFGGMDAKDTWVPTSESSNTWTSVGNYDPTNRLCRTHQDSLGSKPGWGTGGSSYGFRSKLFCCSMGKSGNGRGSVAQFTQAESISSVVVESRKIPRGTSWQDNVDICTENGALLCSRAEICQNGKLKNPTYTSILDGKKRRNAVWRCVGGSPRLSQCVD